ncbi:MAG: hypothetical protein ABIY71_09660 [Flavobacteriales bacterium]
MTEAALCLGMMTAQAQSEKMQDANSSKNCLTSTTDKDWSSLGLSKEQTTQVKQVQSDWLAENAKVADVKAGTMASPMMNSYEGKVQAVLSPEQYENWVKWCSTHASKQVKQKAESATTSDDEMTE